MTRIKDYPPRTIPEFDDFLYLITQGNTDYKLLIESLLGEMTVDVIQPTYELVLADQYHTVRMSFPGAKELTVPEEINEAFVAGTVIRIRNASTAVLTLIPATVGVTINTKDGLNIIGHGEVKLVYRGLDTWDASGDLSS